MKKQIDDEQTPIPEHLIKVAKSNYKPKDTPSQQTKANPQSANFQLIALILIGLGGVIGWWTYNQSPTISKKVSTSKTVEIPVLVEEVEKIKTENQTEYGGVFQNLQKVTVISRLDNAITTEKIKKALQLAYPDQKPDGKYALEVEVFDTRNEVTNLTDEIEIPKIILQFSIIEVASMNKVGEFATTLEGEVFSSKSNDSL